ncbi:MAG: Ribosomal large subunit pseudouridine synthase D [Acidimicrobiaceae bacterium]|nr:Ribosomal large subunit pseudouridine synthase D [Acidimicrobiaceae bacterium]
MNPSEDRHPVEVIPDALNGERLDRIVALLGGVSRNRAATAIDDGAIFVDGSPCTHRSYRVRTGEELLITDLSRDEEAGPVADESVPVAIVHADEQVIVVEKPAGVVVHPGAGNDTGTLLNGLLASNPEIRGVGSSARPGIVHRLDRGTSGLLVVARTQEAYDGLVAQLADRSMGRRYSALCWGRFKETRGLVDAPIGRSPRDRTRMAVVASGKEARTGYEVRSQWSVPEVTLVECRLETGRTHQIRVHLAAIGHPLVGDTAYGGERPALQLDRPFLHAEYLAFDQPSSGRRLQFESALPSDLEDLLAGLGHPEG